MVARAPTTVEALRAAWEDKVTALPDAEQGQAQALLGQARSLMTAADQDSMFPQQEHFPRQIRIE